MAERTGDAGPVEAVESIDLDRYAGTWYEIARYPNRFQDRCAGDAIATYRRLDDDRVEVVNRCRTADGETIDVTGVARLADPDGPASKLEVRFAPKWLGWLPFVWGDYWVLALDPDYRHALVGSPDRNYLWLLSRTPEMDPAAYERFAEAAQEQGFDPSRLVRTKHRDVALP